MTQTELYGLVEGLLGKHLINKPVRDVYNSLPADIQAKCRVYKNTIRSYSPCDG